MFFERGEALDASQGDPCSVCGTLPVKFYLDVINKKTREKKRVTFCSKKCLDKAMLELEGRDALYRNRN